MRSAHPSRQRYQTFRKEQAEASQLRDGESQAQKRETMRRYREWLRPYSRAIGLLFVLSVIATTTELVVPYYTKYVLDDVLLAQVSDDEKVVGLVTTCLAMVVFLGFAQVLLVYRNLLTTKTNLKMTLSLRRRLLDNLLELSFGQLNKLKAGGVVTRLSSDVQNASGILQMAIISPGVAALRIVITVGILFWLNPSLAIFAVVLLPILFYTSALWVRKGRPIYRSMSKDRSAVDGRIAEVFRGIRIVRSFLGERQEKSTYTASHHLIMRKRIWASLIETLADSAWNFFIPGTMVLILAGGGYLYVQGWATIGEIVAMQMYMGMLLNPVYRIVSSLSQLQRALASMDRIFEVFDLHATGEIIPGGSAPAPRRVERLAVRDLSFSYQDGKLVLSGIDFEVRSPKSVAIVGASGAGKTTLCDLIAGFLRPNHGSIQINGENIETFSAATYRRLFGIVSQEVFLFDGSIADNIAYGDPQPDLRRVQKAVEAARLSEMVADLDDGLQTLIGENGMRLSGGQKQRLSIARAYYTNPQVLIFDEATSHLDVVTEAEIQTALMELIQNRLGFIIAHRLSTIRNTDVILVVADGKIVERGSHRELVARKNGVYSQLVGQS